MPGLSPKILAEHFLPLQKLTHIASSQDAANSWVNDHIKSFIGPNGVRFRYIVVGNDAIPGIVASSVPLAMENIYQALKAAGLSDHIKVTTAVAPNALEPLGKSYPPSNGTFCAAVVNIMYKVSCFVYGIGSPLLINVYPYFAFVSDPTLISLEYASFQCQKPVLVDSNYEYYNLFDAMVDAFVAAMARAVGKEDVKIVVFETGWPTEGNEPYTSIANTNIYNSNLRKHVIESGHTPRRADLNLEAYISSMFNENQKPDPVIWLNDTLVLFIQTLLMYTDYGVELSNFELWITLEIEHSIFLSDGC